ncbi:hypothetical protein BV22DRAFT_990206, partial [Leucogyrophana mollusca]
LLYLGNGKIDDKDLPHRTKLTQMILDEYRKEYQKMKLELKNSLGRVSNTTDLWSDPNRDSFMGVTAHFMMRDQNGHLVYRAHLL